VKSLKTQDAPPRRVFLFSGHMIDAPGRERPRIPAEQEPVAREAIERELDRLGISPADLAICGGACGGDLIFAEVALSRGARLELYIPFDEPAFLARSVDFADADWHARFLAAKRQATLHVMPNELGPTPAGDDPYKRNNLWMLQAAERFGTARLEFVCLWDGQGGDGDGGTHHLMTEVRGRAGRVHRLDTTKLSF
jgi:hypothetical protein